MATPKKKHLIELMIEAGVNWPVGAEYAAQDKQDNKVYFFERKPKVIGCNEYFSASGGTTGPQYLLPSLCRKWHQTIVTREQYAEAVAERRPAHFPALPPETFMCRCVAAPVSRTIEQLTAEYHAKAAEADRLQSVADEALKAADDALLALEKAGELIGLVISIDTKPKQAAQPLITDWRDLRVGDVIELTGSKNHCWSKHAGREMIVTKVYPDQGDDDDQVDLRGELGGWSLGGNTTWRFIRRP